MSTTESLPEPSELVTDSTEISAVVVAEPDSMMPVATATNLPVATPLPQPTPVQPPAVRGRPGSDVLALVRAASGQLVPQLQYQLTRLGVAGQAGLAAFVAAAALAITALVPTQHALHSLRAELLTVQHPLTGVGGAGDALPRLVASLPTRAQIPAVIGTMYEQAKSAGVALDKGRYSYAPAKAGAIGRYEVEFPVNATYPAIRTFINGTLTAVPAASLEKLRLERKAVGDQAVTADIGFVVFVRGEGQP